MSRQKNLIKISPTITTASVYRQNVLKTSFFLDSNLTPESLKKGIAGNLAEARDFPISAPNLGKGWSLFWNGFDFQVSEFGSF